MAGSRRPQRPGWGSCRAWRCWGSRWRVTFRLLLEEIYSVIRYDTSRISKCHGAREIAVRNKVGGIYLVGGEALIFPGF